MKIIECRREADCRKPSFGMRFVLALALLFPLASAEAKEKNTDAQKSAKAAVAEFQKYYSDRNEHVRKAAVMGLAECNDVLAVDPLLGAISDPSPLVREQIRIALGKKTAPAAVEAMIALLTKRRNRNLKVLEVILEAFKVSRPEAAFEAVLTLSEDKAFEIKFHATELLGLLGLEEPTGEARLLELSKSRESLVRLAAMESLGKRGSKALPARSTELLASDSDWRVRAACIAALREVRQKEGIQPLITALGKEEGRLRDDCAEALKDITGDAIAATSAEQWQKWWDRVGSRFRVPTLKEIAEKKKKARAALFQYAKRDRKGYGFGGVETKSKRLLFILDVSGSMSERIVVQSEDPLKLAAFRDRYGEASTKIEVAREELISTVESLQPYVAFNIVTFHTVLKPWKKSLVPANRGNKNAAIKFLARLTPQSVDKLAASTSESGRTNTFDAINYAFGLTKKPTARPSKNHKVESDTVFFLTDGMPTAGRITEPGELLRYFSVVNKRAKIVFHTITFGHGNESLMEPIAGRSGGTYMVIRLD